MKEIFEKAVKKTHAKLPRRRRVKAVEAVTRLFMQMEERNEHPIMLTNSQTEDD